MKKYLIGCLLLLVVGVNAQLVPFNKITEKNMSLSDTTLLNASTTKHGFLKKLDNDSTHYMNGKGIWTIPPGSGADDTSWQTSRIDTSYLLSINYSSTQAADYAANKSSFLTTDIDTAYLTAETDPVWQNEKFDYVPYFGAGFDLDLGNYYLGVGTIVNLNHQLEIRDDNSANHAILDTEILSTDRVFQFPDTPGTFALTSDLNDYVEHSFTITSPTASSDYSLGEITVNKTVTAIGLRCYGSTYVAGMLWEYNSVGAAVKALDTVGLYATTNQVVWDSSLSSGGSVSAGNHLFWVTDSTGGNPNAGTVTYLDSTN